MLIESRDEATQMSEGQHEHADDGGPEEPCLVSNVLIDGIEADEDKQDSAHYSQGHTGVVYVRIEDVVLLVCCDMG